jgi:sulfur carrier protein ThiS
MVQITLKLFATLADYLPAGARSNAAALEFETAPSVGGLIDSLNLPPKLVHLVLVNGSFISPEARATRRLAAGDTLAIWPPIAGG